MACIIPEGKKNKIVAGVIVVSFVLSYIFNTLSVFAGISSGVKIMILTVIISLAAANIISGKGGRKCITYIYVFLQWLLQPMQSECFR